MRGLAVAGLISLVFLFLAACGGGDAGDPDVSGDFPTLALDDSGGVPSSDNVPATVESRVAGTITAQDNELATAVAKGVDRVMRYERYEEEAPTPTPLIEDEVRVPVFPPENRARRVSGSAPLFLPLRRFPLLRRFPRLLQSLPLLPRLFRFPRPTTAPPPPAGPGPCPAGLSLHLESGIGKFSGSYGGHIEHLHNACRPYSCLEQVTDKVYLSDYHPDIERGYALIFAVCDEYQGEFAGLRSGVLSGSSEYGRQPGLSVEKRNLGRSDYRGGGRRLPGRAAFGQPFLRRHRDRECARRG